MIIFVTLALKRVDTCEWECHQSVTNACVCVSVFLCLNLCGWMLNDVVPEELDGSFLVVFFVAALALFQRDLKLDAFRRDGQSVAGAPVTIFALYSVDVVSLSRFRVFARIVCAKQIGIIRWMIFSNDNNQW